MPLDIQKAGLKFKLTRNQEFLCACIRHSDFLDRDLIVSLYNQVGDDALYAEAELNGVVSIVAHALTICFPDQELPARWKTEFDSVARRIASYLAELKQIAQKLRSHGIKLIALKNSGIACALYCVPGASPMGDVDVLVSKKDFHEAHRILVEAGYLLKFRNEFEADDIDEAYKGGGAEYSVILENGEHLWFELQWRPISGRWIQPEQEPKAEALFERAIDIEGSSVMLLSPEDNLIQVALHTAKHSFVRSPGFRLHTDVDRVIACQEVDWEKFLQRVSELKIRTAVYFSLAMAKSLLNTPVPDFVLQKLSVPGWKRAVISSWLQKVGLFEPDAPKWSKVGYIIFVSLLYDRFGDLLRGVIPRASSMRERYDYNGSLMLPYFYLVRIKELIFQRVKT